jgi:hypothetical protein
VELKSVVAYVESAKSEGEWFSAGGIPVRVISDDHVILSLGGVEVELHTASTEAIPEFANEAAKQPRMAGIYLYARVQDADVAFTQYRSLTTYDEPVVRPWGNREFLIHSPSGLKLVLYSR